MDTREQVFLGLEELFRDKTKLKGGEIFTVPSESMGIITTGEIAYYSKLKGFPVLAIGMDSDLAYFKYEGGTQHA